jgi:hypothetical protein
MQFMERLPCDDMGNAQARRPRPTDILVRPANSGSRELAPARANAATMNASQQTIMRQTLLFVSALLLISPTGLLAGEPKTAPVFSQQIPANPEPPITR